MKNVPKEDARVVISPDARGSDWVFDRVEAIDYYTADRSDKNHNILCYVYVVCLVLLINQPLNPFKLRWNSCCIGQAELGHGLSVKYTYAARNSTVCKVIPLIFKIHRPHSPLYHVLG